MHKIIQELKFEASYCFIGNVWTPSNSGKTIDLNDPSTGELITKIARGKEAGIKCELFSLYQ